MKGLTSVKGELHMEEKLILNRFSLYYVVQVVGHASMKA
jgi:hypothetical protein